MTTPGTSKKHIDRSRTHRLHPDTLSTTPSGYRRCGRPPHEASRSTVHPELSATRRDGAFSALITDTTRSSPTTSKAKSRHAAAASVAMPMPQLLEVSRSLAGRMRDDPFGGLRTEA